MRYLNNKIGRPFIWLWMAVLLVSTTGISIHKIYCYCVGETTVSLFAVEDRCGMSDKDNADCCKPELPNCCSKKSLKKSHCSPHKKDSCTKKSSTVVQLKPKFTTGDFFKFKNFEYAAATVDFPYFRIFAATSAFEALFFNKAPPPLPLSGRDIGIRLRVFRC